MTPEKKSRDNYSIFETRLKIKLTDGRVLYAYGKGNLHLTVLNSYDKINIVLQNVLFVPKLQNKLFSLPSITKTGDYFEFKGKSCGITIDGKQYTLSHKHSNFYKPNTTVPDKTCCIGQTSTQEPLKVWYQRYDHLGYNNLKLTNNTDMVNGVNLDFKKTVGQNCEGFAMGKHHPQRVSQQVC